MRKCYLKKNVPACDVAAVFIAENFFFLRVFASFRLKQEDEVDAIAKLAGTDLSRGRKMVCYPMKSAFSSAAQHTVESVAIDREWP